MLTELEKERMYKEAMQTIADVDKVIKEVTKPAKVEDVTKFCKQAGLAVALHLNKNQASFGFTSRGLEIYNPTKAKIIQ